MSGKAPVIGRGRGRGILVSDFVRVPERPSREPPSAQFSREDEPEASGREAFRSVYVTKPSTVAGGKLGTSGTPVQLSTNYFKLTRKLQFEFGLYRVDFRPEIENVMMRKAFVAKQRETFGGYLYDGANMIYLTQRLREAEMTFQIESREGQKYKMTVKSTGTKIEATDSMASQILNLILRQAMDGLQMQLVGRNLYDPQSKVSRTTLLTQNF